MYCIKLYAELTNILLYYSLKCITDSSFEGCGQTHFVLFFFWPNNHTCL